MVPSNRHTALQTTSYASTKTLCSLHWKLNACSGARQQRFGVHNHSQNAYDGNTCWVSDEEYSWRVRRQGGGLGGMASPNWDTPSPAISHSEEPICPCNCERKGTLSHHAPWCTCSRRCHKWREQAQYSEAKIDKVEVRRKKQCNEGRSEALQYFKNIQGKTLTWTWTVWLSVLVEVGEDGLDDIE